MEAFQRLLAAEGDDDADHDDADFGRDLPPTVQRLGPVNVHISPRQFSRRDTLAVRSLFVRHAHLPQPNLDSECGVDVNRDAVRVGWVRFGWKYQAASAAGVGLSIRAHRAISVTPYRVPQRHGHWKEFEMN